MEPLVLTYLTALRALRRARRIDSGYSPAPVGRPEQRRALLDSIPRASLLDLESLEAIGALDDELDSPVDLLVGDRRHRRCFPGVSCRAVSRPLPAGSLIHLGNGLFMTSPAMTALLCSAGRSVGEVLPLLMELLGTYTLPESATHPIAYGGIWPDPGERDGKGPESAESVNPAQSDAKPEDLSVDQAHYRCEPIVTLRELELVAAWGSSKNSRAFHQALQIAATGSASPCETIMCGMFGAPMGYGGFGICGIPGGMRLNETIRFDQRARGASGGMPYAIADAYIPSARVALEYNGAYHEQVSSQLHDNRRNNGLRAMGIDVLVLDRAQMRDLQALEAIAMTIYKRADMRFRYRVTGYRLRQQEFLNAMRRATGLPPA